MPFPPASKTPRIDQVSKRILRSLPDHVAVDSATLAKELDIAEDVVRARLRTMREHGLVQGFRLRVDARQLGQSFEFLVTGTPGDRTDRDALDRLCTDPQVTRAFGLASAHSVAFTVVGRDLATTRAHALDLAGRVGLGQVQAILVIATFTDRAGGFVPALLPEGAPMLQEAAPAVAHVDLVGHATPEIALGEAVAS
ncbi:MAG: Lrp/AsnC family transcriptional regulator [Candidatus Thermoplasmatota archaeon]